MIYAKKFSRFRITKNVFGNTRFMRKVRHDLELVKNEIMKLKGCSVKMKVNKGRKKIVSFNAVIAEVYSAVFVVHRSDPGFSEVQSYSYSDVLCGDVRLKSLC